LVSMENEVTWVLKVLEFCKPVTFKGNLDPQAIKQPVVVACRGSTNLQYAIRTF